MMTMTRPEPEYGPDVAMPRVYVASLTDYNAGRLVGEWIAVDGSEDIDEIQAHVDSMLTRAALNHPEDGPYEEIAIHDYEGFGGYSVGEYTSLARVLEIGTAIDESGDADAFTVWLGLSSYNVDNLDNFADEYCGSYESMKDYAEVLAEEFGWITAMEAAGINASYFDADQYATDLECGDYSLVRHSGNGYVFRSV